MLLTSTLKTPETTVAFQQHVSEVAGGTLPHCYGALQLTFGNTIDAIKRKKNADEQKAREEAEMRAAIEAELISRPTQKCEQGCKEISIQYAHREGGCSRCSGSFECSKCHVGWRWSDSQVVRIQKAFGQ